MHEDFAAALRLLAGFELPHAEAWRLLIPVAERLDLPRPSYWRVRRFLIAERERRARIRAEVDPVITDLLAGFLPIWRW